MCTVTFLPRAGGFALAMNRDEQRSRVIGNPPALTSAGGRRVVCPSEPGGGTWIGLNDGGTALALINWYSLRRTAPAPASSRGLVVRAALAGGEAPEVEAAVAGLPLAQTSPFRLIGVFPRSEQVWEWRWDLERLAGRRFPWRPEIWISSGHDEPGAESTRRSAFEAARRRVESPDAAWLRTLHGSHEPERGAYSICMHRADAVTVSLTEIDVGPGRGTMTHLAGSPCEARSRGMVQVELPLGSSPAA